MIALSFVGVCGTDLQILNGSRPDIAEILGHEGVGVVVNAGAGAALQVGESVVFNPTAQMHTGVILGHNVPGLFQRYFAVDAPALDQGLVLASKDCVPPVCGALIEPLGAVLYSHELVSRITPELRTVAVFGAGPIGLLSTLYLVGLGVRVILVHPSQSRLDTAISLKLAEAVSTLLPGDDLPRRMLSRTGGERFDAALICTTRQGAPAALAHAVQVLKGGGCIDMISNYPETAPTPEGITAEAIRAVRAANACGAPAKGEYVGTAIAGHRITFTGHRGTSRDHLLRAAQLLQSNTSRYARLITHVLALCDAAGAIETLAGSHNRLLYGYDCIKAVINMTSLPASSPDVPSCAPE